MDTFQLEGHEYVELKNLLKLLGWCETGGMAMTAIDEGLVTVDGQVERRKRCKIRTGQTVTYEAHSVRVEGSGT